MDLINPAVQSYAEDLTSPASALLQEIDDFTRDHHREYNMLSGHLQGKVLAMISQMIRPSRILEIGTFTGYSALCLASGLAKGGELHTIDIREEDVKLARAYFDRSPLGPNIISHTGNALDIIPTLAGDWDLVFIDADKPAYTEYFNLVLPRVRQNGFILADNIFFHGQVLEEGASGKSAKGIRDFNDHIRNRADIEKVVLTIRDGLLLVRKL